MGQTDRAAETRTTADASGSYNPQDVVEALCSRSKRARREACRALRSDAHRDLWKLLTPDQQRALALNGDGNSFIEIADKMRSSTSGVENLLQSARKNLRQAVGLDVANESTVDDHEAA